MTAAPPDASGVGERPSLVCGHAECVTGLECRRTSSGPSPAPGFTGLSPLAQAREAAHALRAEVLAATSPRPLPPGTVAALRRGLARFEAAAATSGGADPAPVVAYVGPSSPFGMVTPHPSHAWVAGRSGGAGVCLSCGSVTGFRSSFTACTGSVPQSRRALLDRTPAHPESGDTPDTDARPDQDCASGVGHPLVLALPVDELWRLRVLLAGPATFGDPVAVRVRAAVLHHLARITAEPNRPPT